MSYWIGESRLQIESFILNRTTIVQIDDFARNHDKYLVSISAYPQEASKCWFFQRDKTTPGEGWVSLRLNGQEIMPLDAWTNIEYFWHNVIEVIQHYTKTGYGQGSFSDEAAYFSIEQKMSSIAVFSLRGSKHIVNPQQFLPALLMGAKSFYKWHQKHVGTLSANDCQQPQKLIRQLELDTF